MRESIGGSWLLTIVIVFIVLFTSFLALSINYSKAFKVKNGIVNIVEKNEGVSNEAKSEIKKYLNTVGYIVYSTCPSYTDVSNLESARGFERSSSSPNKYKYCIARVIDDSGNITKNYYKVTVFFRVDLPIFGDIFTFPITGETKPVYFANDDGYNNPD